MRIIFVKFREISHKYPIVRGMVSYSIIWPTACLLQQKIIGKEEFNYAEAARFSLYGGLYVAPTLYCWLKCASYLWPKANLKSAITKVHMHIEICITFYMQFNLVNFLKFIHIKNVNK